MGQLLATGISRDIEFHADLAGQVLPVKESDKVRQRRTCFLVLLDQQKQEKK